MARLTKQFESATVEWNTPDSIYDPLNKEFGFNLDVCATSENTKCGRFYTKEDNGLLQSWFGICWMNPPYGRELAKWIYKAAKEQKNGVTTVALIPARTNTGWWHDIIMPKAEIRFIRGRPKFGNAKEGLPWPMAVVVFYGNKRIINEEEEIENDRGKK